VARRPDRYGLEGGVLAALGLLAFRSRGGCGGRSSAQAPSSTRCSGAGGRRTQRDRRGRGGCEFSSSWSGAGRLGARLTMRRRAAEARQTSQRRPKRSEATQTRPPVELCRQCPPRRRTPVLLA
jgi:hypothetical protein